jgi:hypothetical protein
MSSWRIILKEKMKLSNLINVTEAFTARFSDLDWHWDESTSKFTADTEIRDIKIKLIIEIASFQVQEKTCTWLNIAFARIVDGEEVQTLTNTGDMNQSMIFGAVMNALTDKVSELDDKYTIDAIVLIAAAGETKRRSLYHKMLAKSHGIAHWNIAGEATLKTGVALIATKHQLGGPLWKALNAELEAQGKPLI